MDLVVTTLCKVSDNVPVAVNMLFEQIMEELAPYDAQRLVHIVCRFTAPGNPCSAPTVTSSSSTSLRVMSFHVLSTSTRFMSSAQLLEELPYILTTIMPAVNSPLVDLRKAAIFALVEMYLVVGDALYPYIKYLSPPQKKLLTIYIERKVKSRREN
jgi:hypothetical protein